MGPLVVCLSALFGVATAATCSFTNVQPFSTGAYVTVKSTQLGTPYVTSSTVSFGDTTYFECTATGGAAAYIDIYNAAGEKYTHLMSTQELRNGISCQAINGMILEPLAALRAITGSTLYGYDFSRPSDADSPNSVDSSKIRVFFLNSAYNGDVVWKHSDSSTSTWTTFTTTIGFDSGKVLDTDPTPGTRFRVRAETTAGVVIATSSTSTSSSADAGVAWYYNLIGTSGSEQLILSKGCGTAGSNCDSCSSSSMEVWVIVVIVVGAVVIIGSIIGLAVWYCNKSDSVKSGQGSDVQESNPATVEIQDTTDKQHQPEDPDVQQQELQQQV